MRKYIALLGVTAMTSVVPTVPASPAHAAEIIRGGDCSGEPLDANGNFIDGAVFYGTLLTRITKSGLTTLTCHYDVPEQYWLSKAVHASGFNCYIGGQLTTDSRASMSTGGRMVLTCRIRA